MWCGDTARVCWPDGSDIGGETRVRADAVPVRPRNVPVAIGSRDVRQANRRPELTKTIVK